MHLINSTNIIRVAVKTHIPDIDELTLNRIVNEIIDNSEVVTNISKEHTVKVTYKEQKKG